MACRPRIVPGRDGLGRDVRGGCDETFSVLAATKIPVGEFAVRQYGEISLAATVTPTVRPPRRNQWTPASRQDAEIAATPRVSVRAFPVDANLRNLARLHAGHGAIL